MSCKPFKENRSELPAAPAAALYVHVPFCRAKCRYCDFFSQTLDTGLAGRFVEAAKAELSAQVRTLATPLATLFLGGGTPTVLGAELLGKLLDPLLPLIYEATEFSVEANPGVLDAGVVRLLRQSGVSRVNLGAQSFQADELEILGRIHTVDQIGQAVRSLRAAGITNLGLDLIYGIPGQTLASWRDSLARSLALPIEHLSCYALSFEPQTPLHRDLQAQRVAEMPDELQRDCYYAAIDAASQAGLEHYEISNFARPGMRCRHNLTYWHNEPYLGIGPGAASYIDQERRTNRPDLQAYLEAALGCRTPPSTAERLTGRAAMAESLMLGLRLVEGVDRAKFTARFGQDPYAAFTRSLSRHERAGAVVATSTHLRIAEQWLFVSDSILADVICQF